MNAPLHPVPDSVTLIPLREATNASHSGRKAAALAELVQAGFDVPDGFVIPVGASPSLGEIERALARLGNVPVAVRSSGVAEDLEDASYAGYYSSVLDVRGAEAVLSAMKRVLASAEPREIASLSEARPMAVLVQTMVRADAAGVAFSANPLTGARDEVRISATRGLGDRLLAGEVDGDEWSVKGAVAKVEREPQAALTADAAARIAALTREVEASRGVPQDVEWALSGERLALLQARPITVLPIAPAVETPKGSWQKDIGHFPDPLTPFGASTNLKMTGVFDDAIAEWGLLPDGFEGRVIGHELYIHIEPDDGGAKPPPWWVLGLVARLLPSLRRKLRRSHEAVESGLLESLPREWETKLKPELLEQIRKFREVDLQALDDEALWTELEALHRFASDCMRLHFRLFVPYVVGVHELAQACKELLGWESHQMVRLLQGLSTTSSAATRELALVAAFARDRKSARAVIEAGGVDVLGRLEQVDPEVSARLSAYLKVWGVRTFGSDAGTPNVDEKPELVARLLADLMQGDAESSPLAAREQALADARSALTTDEARARFERALAFAETVYPLREDNVLLTDQMPTGLLRRVGMEFGRRLTRLGMLKKAEDAAMLGAEELRDALRGSASTSLKDLVERRRCEHLWVRANPGPAVYGAPPAPTPDLRGLPEASRRVNGAMLWELEQELTRPAAAKAGALGGVAASSGVYRGKARVIRSTSELHSLCTGEVLVCPTTSAAWMMVFARAGALVSEHGSALSHTAIVAREHSLPAVVGVAGALSALRTGDEVIVDGNRGTVTLVRE
jgi:pyruvate,water dikinase